MPIFLGLIIAPAAVLLMWYGLPIFKDLMIHTVATWGVDVGLSGFALDLANAMPLIVPVMCIAGIIAGFIFLARSSRMG